jgi:hypothetical protein
MRSSFDLAVKKLAQDDTDASGLGLQIGFEYGPMNVTRLGMKGELVRCSVSRGVLTAEKEQGRCRGDETAIGVIAYGKASDAVCRLFGDTRKRAGLDYDTVLEAFGEERQRRQGCKGDGCSGILKARNGSGKSLQFPQSAHRGLPNLTGLRDLVRRELLEASTRAGGA